MKSRNPFIAAAMAALAAASAPAMIHLRKVRAQFNHERHHRGWFAQGQLPKPNGPRECARRLRQIKSGQLTVANGLTSVGLNARIHWFDGTRINKPGRA